MISPDNEVVELKRQNSRIYATYIMKSRLSVPHESWPLQSPSWVQDVSSGVGGCFSFTIIPIQEKHLPSSTQRLVSVAFDSAMALNYSRSPMYLLRQINQRVLSCFKDNYTRWSILPVPKLKSLDKMASIHTLMDLSFKVIPCQNFAKSCHVLSTVLPIRAFLPYIPHCCIIETRTNLKNKQITVQ